MAITYSLEERCRIATLMTFHRSTFQVKICFQQEFDKLPPDHKTIRKIYKHFIRTGSVGSKKYSRAPKVTGEVNQVRVLAHFTMNPTCSIREASQELDLSVYAVHKCLKKIKMKPYRIGHVQGLLPGDLPRREQACSVLAQMTELDPDVTNRMVFSDEATFRVSGFVNSSTCRYWSHENPHVAYQQHRDSPKIHVWCGMTSRVLIGPFLFAEASVQHTNYLDMLQNFAFPIMHDLGITDDGYFMQDGAPPHWALEVREFLDENLPGRWIGRDGPLNWPPRSPDLTPCDFFLWGSLKNTVYKTPVANLDDLRQKIINACLEIRPEVLTTVFEEMIDRWNICAENNGGSTEKSLVL